jgi:hypothetical protein
VGLLMDNLQASNITIKVVIKHTVTCQNDNVVGLSVSTALASLSTWPCSS